MDEDRVSARGGWQWSRVWYFPWGLKIDAGMSGGAGKTGPARKWGLMEKKKERKPSRGRPRLRRKRRVEEVVRDGHNGFAGITPIKSKPVIFRNNDAIQVSINYLGRRTQ